MRYNDQTDGNRLYPSMGNEPGEGRSPGSPGSQQGHLMRTGSYQANEGAGYGPIEGLYQDVKKRRVEPVYDAGK
jgi:hypothetical protein